MNIYGILVVRPLEPGRRVHTTVQYNVLASDPEEATVKLESYLKYRVYTPFEFMAPPVVMGEIQADNYGTLTPGEFDRLRGIQPAPPKVRTPKPTTRVLGEIQREVLKSLKGHSGWGPNCGWIWSTPSKTAQLMESLRLRCLVDFNNGTYTINERGLQALEQQT
jgi:hypothetical protein